jgi:hypothetical protein
LLIDEVGVKVKPVFTDAFHKLTLAGVVGLLLIVPFKIDLVFEPVSLYVTANVPTRVAISATED